MTGSSSVTVSSSVSQSTRRNRSSRCMASLCGYPSESSHVRSSTPTVSTTNVDSATCRQMFRTIWVHDLWEAADQPRSHGFADRAHDISFVILHVEVELTMRIRIHKFRHRSLQGY